MIAEHYVSLGNTCEVAFQFRRVLGHDSSSFFSWKVTPFDALARILVARFEGVMSPEAFMPVGDGEMIEDQTYGYYFHSPFSASHPERDPLYALKLDAFRSKSSYLVEKFLRTAQSGDKVTYFYKTDEEDALGKANAICQALVSLHKSCVDFVLVIVQDASRREPPWDHDRVFNRYVRRLAPLHDATDAHVSSYDKLFREFPHKLPLRLSGY